MWFSYQYENFNRGHYQILQNMIDLKYRDFVEVINCETVSQDMS